MWRRSDGFYRSLDNNESFSHSGQSGLPLLRKWHIVRNVIPAKGGIQSSSSRDELTPFHWTPGAWAAWKAMKISCLLTGWRNGVWVGPSKGCSAQAKQFRWFSMGTCGIGVDASYQNPWISNHPLKSAISISFLPSKCSSFDMCRSYSAMSPSLENISAPLQEMSASKDLLS